MNDEYFLKTNPLEFIRDVANIFIGGDGLSPETLIKDVSDLINNYLKQHPDNAAYQAYELCQTIESLGASKELTDLVIKASEVTRELSVITFGDASKIA